MVALVAFAAVSFASPGLDVQSLVRMVAGAGRNRNNRTAWMIRTANSLIDAGPDRALAAFRANDAGGRGHGDLDAADLMRLVFQPAPTLPTGPIFPPYPEPNVMKKELRTHFLKSPRFPMIVVEDVPFTLVLGGYIGAGGWPFPTLKDYERYPLGTKRLVPSNDPFLACEKLIASDQWPFPKHSKSDRRFAIPYRENEGNVMRQVLELVSDVYRPVTDLDSDGSNGIDLPKFHRGFLKLHAHWDDRLQRYVKGT
jgi:hypothetical protein